MFTGIIQGVGRLRGRRGSALDVETPLEIGDRLTLGASVAVSGVCLTVVAFDEGTFCADLSAETAARTTLSRLGARASVNLELPVRPTDGLDGHLVLGHVDAVGRVKAIVRRDETSEFVFSYPASFHRFLAEKGAVAVDGISLTPFGVTPTTFRCAAIPETLRATTLHERRTGDPVNIEFDILAKYVEGMVRRVHQH